MRTARQFGQAVPKSLFEGHYYVAKRVGWDIFASYDVSPDGKRFLMLKPAATQNAGSGQLHIVVNWFEELRRRVLAEK